jgi:hypothetical protein
LIPTDSIGGVPLESNPTGPVKAVATLANAMAIIIDIGANSLAKGCFMVVSPLTVCLRATVGATRFTDSAPVLGDAGALVVGLVRLGRTAGINLSLPQCELAQQVNWVHQENGD